MKGKLSKWIMGAALAMSAGSATAQTAAELEWAKWQALQTQTLSRTGGPPPAYTVQSIGSYSGSNAGGPEWVRPFADGSCCSGLGPVRYHVETFTVSANDSCHVSSVQGSDLYIFIYANAFDPGNQTVNFVAGDDDGDGGIGTSDIYGLGLNAGTTYHFVTTGFSNGDEAEFTNTIDCPTASVSIGEELPPTAANLRLSFTGPVTPVRSGTAVPVFLRLDNYGPDPAYPPTVEFNSSSPIGSVSVTPPGGWSCEGNDEEFEEERLGAKASTAYIDQPEGASFVCTYGGNLARGTSRFTFQVTAPANPPGGFVTLNASVESQSVDPIPSNNSASFKLYVKPSGSILMPVSPSIR